MKLIIAGDFCQRHRVDEAVRKRRFGELFDEVRTIINTADYSIVNFEFPIILDSTNAKPIFKCGPNLQGTIEAVDAVKYAGFNCCTLANNHILDQGEQSCLDTKNELEKAGIDTVGVGNNLEDAASILYKEIQGETLAIINCCEHEFSIATDTTAGANPLNPIQQYYRIQEAQSKADYVLVIVHGGHEHYQLPSPRMQELYRFFVDAGANAVVNHHQHCYSGYEFYKGAPIVYGLGNLCFDHPQKRNDIWNEGYIANIEFKKNAAPVLEVIPYFQCKEDVGVHLDLKNAGFFDKLEELNRIIIGEELISQYNTFVKSRSSAEISIHLPYKSRILRKLYSLGICPSFVSKEKWVRLLNYIETESHRDIQIEVIKRILC